MNESHPRSPVVDVVIAGAGPVGLFLACELRLGGASVLVLERAESPQSVLKARPFGLRGLTVPTVEAFRHRGLLDDMLGGGPRGRAGHFAGIAIDPGLVDASRWHHRRPGAGGGGAGEIPAGGLPAVEMERVEAVLAARALALGAEIRRGTGVDGFEEDEDGVGVRAGGLAFRARWLVGCDGGRSAVRKAGGFAFAGTEPEFTGYSIQAELAEPGMLKLGRHPTPAGVYAQMQPGFFGLAEFDGGAGHRGGPLTRERVEAVLRRASGADVTVTALHAAATWTDRARQATAYRRGRVLLAGDAAHVHSPLGGQGLNLGLGDAMNLGWKLAASARGDAPAGLLDSYGTERHPVGARVLDWSRAQVALMRPEPAARALEAVLRDLAATRDGATTLAERACAASLRHDLGGGHPLVGHGVPDLPLAGGAGLAALLRGGLGRGRGVLIDFGARAPLRALAGRWGDRVASIEAVASAPGPAGLLVRPDGVVAWACDGELNFAEAAAAGDRWFAVRDAVACASP